MTLRVGRESKKAGIHTSGLGCAKGFLYVCGISMMLKYLPLRRLTHIFTNDVVLRQEEWAAILKLPKMALLARVTLFVCLLTAIYAYIDVGFGYFVVRGFIIIGACAIFIKFIFDKMDNFKNNIAPLSLIPVNLHYVFCGVVCVLDRGDVKYVPMVLIWCPLIFIGNNVFLRTVAALYVNLAVLAATILIFAGYLHDTNGFSDWTLEKNISVTTVVISITSLLVLHISMLAKEKNTELLTQAQNAVREMQMNQAFDLERKQFLSDLARINRVYIIETMALTISHEISQPINSTSVFLGAIKRWLAGPTFSVEEAVTATDKAIAQLDRAREIVLSIKGFVRKGSETQEVVDLVTCLNDVLRLMQNELDFHNVRVTFSEPHATQPIRVRALKHEVEQIIINLLMNSMEAFAEQDKDRRIKINFDCSNVSVEVRIEDNGPGFPPELKSEMFSRFVTTKEYGTGLGLAICAGLAEKFGGQLDMVPAPGRGAVAVLRLPLLCTTEMMSDQFY